MGGSHPGSTINEESASLNSIGDVEWNEIILQVKVS